jgi:hypothetical protein
MSSGGWPKRSRAAVGSCVGQFDLPGGDCGLGRRSWSPEKILAAAALETISGFRDETSRRTTRG